MSSKVRRVMIEERKCADCGREIFPTAEYAYRIGKNYYCCYSHYVKAGGDGGSARLKREERRRRAGVSGARDRGMQK